MKGQIVEEGGHIFSIFGIPMEREEFLDKKIDDTINATGSTWESVSVVLKDDDLSDAEKQYMCYVFGSITGKDMAGRGELGKILEALTMATKLKDELEQRKKAQGDA